MRAAATVRSCCTPSGTLLLGALLFAPVAGCGDDGTASDGTDAGTGSTTGEASSTGGPASTSAGTTSGDSSTGGDPTTSSTAGSTTDDGTTTGSGTSASTGGSTTEGDSGSSTGASAVDVPFTVLDPSGLELTARVPAGWVVVTTAAQWASFTDTPVPAGVTFPTQWVLFGSRGPLPYPGHTLGVDALSWQGDTLTVAADHVDPAGDCETYEFIWPADTLVAFDALDGDVEAIDEQVATTEASCAGGGADSMDCDLDAPCGQGLLCAGIVRSTVLANNPGGLCLDSSYRGTFDGPAVVIPPDGATAQITTNVAGLTTVDMDVTILLDLDHPAPEELVIELRNPDGNQVSVANLQDTPLHPGSVPIVPNGFSGDESVNGTWTLIVRDDVDNANSGSVQGWSLEIMSRFD